MEGIELAIESKARVPAKAIARFVPVNIVEAPAAASVPTGRRLVGRAGKGAKGVIEIELGDGRRLKVDADADTDVLARVLDVLERR